MYLFYLEIGNAVEMFSKKGATNSGQTAVLRLHFGLLLRLNLQLADSK